MKKAARVPWRAFLSIVLLVSPASALEVTMSRYLVTADGAQTLAVDQTVLESLCKDEDGCQVILTMELDNFTSVFMKETRFRMALLPGVDHNGWAESGGAGRDDNDNREIVAEVVAAGPTPCTFSDAEDGVNDNLIGFTLKLSGNLAPQALCTLVLVD